MTSPMIPPLVPDGGKAGQENSAVAVAALRWDLLRVEALRLKAQRASFRCEYECDAEYNEHGYCTEEAVVPCWKWIGTNQRGEEITTPQSEWCEPCQQRQPVHVSYQQTMKLRGAAMRRLYRACANARKGQGLIPPDGSGSE